jgi:hypothetical protein
MYENLPGIEKWKILQQNFGKTGWNKSGILRSTLLKTELFCLNSFLQSKEEPRSVAAKTGRGKAQLEVVCYLKEGRLG